jgi:hypothetical protein
VSEPAVLTVADVGTAALRGLLDRYGLDLVEAVPGTEISGSYWGDSEAGVIGRTVHARPDTPIHSVLHEACHVICMDPARRRSLERDAGGDDLEEAAVCYLQVVLADELPGVGRERLMQDMDAWGYSFRLGSTRAWFEDDAGDAAGWLAREGLLMAGGEPIFRLRGAL